MDWLRDRELTFYLEWISTALLIISMALTSFNIHPLNLWISLLANFSWFVTSLLWRKWSLVTVNLVIITVVAAGLANIYL
jgi:hypothetical protein